MKTSLSCALTLGLVVALATVPGAQVTKDTLPGVTNYAHVQTTVACAGATTPASLTEIKRLGYKSVINLREATEQGADVEGEAAAAKTAGINFVHLPFNARMPEPTLADNFLKAVTDPANVPAFIHCASGNRAAAMWALKRIQVDGWDADRAFAEATELGLTNAALKTYVLDYVQAHKK
jgi:uncharacterized protein (TIGR01244 family)